MPIAHPHTRSRRCLTAMIAGILRYCTCCLTPSEGGLLSRFSLSLLPKVLASRLLPPSHVNTLSLSPASAADPQQPPAAVWRRASLSSALFCSHSPGLRGPLDRASELR